MPAYELRDPDDARRFLLQGVWWQRSAAPTAEMVREALQWALHAASLGAALPPLGFIADLGRAAFHIEAGPRPAALASAPALPINILRTYEDHVVGKLYTDLSFARGAETLRGYEGRDRARGLAFALGRFMERCGFEGVHLNPVILRRLAEIAPDDFLRQGWQSLRQEGPHELNERLIQSLIAATRRIGDMLAPDDVAAIEAGDALADEGEQVARRQVRRAAAALEATLPLHGPRPRADLRETPTRLLEEDAYPVGGFASISTRGSIESLLHSQLAYMETDERPDLFDVKFLRDELLYYSRDENQFLRRRRSFVFVLHSDLTASRFKDVELPYQRGVLLLALLTTALRKLTDWLSEDGLIFEVLVGGKGAENALAPEIALLKTLWRDALENETARIRYLNTANVGEFCDELARRGRCCCLMIAVDPPLLDLRGVETAFLTIDGPRPLLTGAEVEEPSDQKDEAIDAWAATLKRLLWSWA